MILKHLFLENFRSYTKSEFNFSNNTTIIIGPNTSGKTNLIEAIYLLSVGKSPKTEKEEEILQFEKEIARVRGVLEDDTSLEVVITKDRKKYLVNGVSKRRVDFSENFKVVLFSPIDLDLVIGSPSKRRGFLDEVLEQVNRDYRIATNDYTKALRQRNALLENVQETGIRNEEIFEYWDELLIRTGNFITKKREEFIEFINHEKKNIFEFSIIYDESIISKERLLQYKQAEVGAGVTLVGPHRDDFLIRMHTNKISPNASESRDVKVFGSRGQQRLVVLQLKLLQILFIQQILGEPPTLLLDDIFSELDEGHINLVLEMTKGQQTIITTTHKEFIKEKFTNKAHMVELKLK